MPSPATHPLVRCLEREIEAITRLLEKLREEHAALRANDADRIEAIVESKGRVLAELDAVGKERDHLMKQAGFDPHRESDRGLPLSTGTQRIEIMRAWRRLLELGEQCIQQNAVNGALIQSGLRHARQMIAVLRGQPPDEHPSYGPGGDVTVGTGARTLGKA
jgi:flagella synthesis protein FlgN